jgi:copper homeostasis protein
MLITRKLEICCYTVESAVTAEKAGADRIEFCDNYSEGGTTPSWAAIQYVVQNLTIPVNVIVRPRGGDFLYSKAEYEIVKNEVLKIKELGANGIVIGFLKPGGEIDMERTTEITKLAGNMEVTFHRAFDMCRNPFKALEQLKNTGIKRILTSGAKNKAFEGTGLIADLVKKAGNIIIMPGSGINENNLSAIMKKTGAVEFHSSAKKFTASKMKYFNAALSMGGNQNMDEYKIIGVDENSVRKMAAILKDNS